MSGTTVVQQSGHTTVVQLAGVTYLALLKPSREIGIANPS